MFNKGYYMKLNKILLGIISTLCMCFTIFPTTSCGREKYTKGLEFTLWPEENEYYVTGYKGTDTDVIIPSIYKNKPVTGICDIFGGGDIILKFGNVFKDCDFITSISIPDSVTYICNNAFEGCSSLKSVMFGNGLTSISHGMFEGCNSLENIAIPNSVTSIGAFAFSECSSLKTVTIPDSVTYIEFAAFDGCSSLESVTIPNNVTYIGSFAFDDCSSLKSIIISDSVTKIDYSAFSKCTSLKIVNYTGTEEQWSSIEIRENNDYLKNANIIYNYKG